MQRFQVFDGNREQFDERTESREHRWYIPGTRIVFPKFVESSFSINIYSS